MQGGASIHFASRALTGVEKCYNQIYKENLSIVFGLTRFHTLTLMVGKWQSQWPQEPLVAVLKKPVKDNLAWLTIQRMVCRIIGYDVEFKYVKGKDFLIADALRTDLKRLTKTKARSNKRLKWPDLFTNIRSKLITSHLAEISEATAQDMYWLTACNPYIDLLSVKYELSFSNGIVYRNDRIQVTAALQKTLITN